MKILPYLCSILLAIGPLAIPNYAQNNDHLSIIFAVKQEEANKVLVSTSRNLSGQLEKQVLRLPFPIKTQQTGYQVEKLYPLEVFRHASLRDRFEAKLGGRLFVLKAKVDIPANPFAISQLLLKEFDHPAVLFAGLNGEVGVPEKESITAIPHYSPAPPSPSAAGPSASLVPTDPLYADSYNLKLVQANLAWDKTKGSRNPIVAVVDTGINFAHQDLVGSNFVNTAEIPNNGKDDDNNGIVDDYNLGLAVQGGEIIPNGTDVHGHGTAVASVIGARMNGLGMVGVAPECRILSVRFLKASGAGTYEDSYIALGLTIETISTKSLSSPFKGWINNSWSGSFRTEPAHVLKAIFDLAYEEGIGISSAAGNAFGNNDQIRFIPASVSSPSHLAVGATDNLDQAPVFTNIGPKTVHHGAPGLGIPVALWKGERLYGFGDGTSFASPHDAGTAVLINALFPQATVDQVVARILLNNDKNPELAKLWLSEGRLNVFKALAVDNLPPPDLIWASPLTAYHNQVSLGWKNSPDTGAVRILLFTDQQEEIANTLVIANSSPFQKEELRGLQENTRYFPMLIAMDNVGNTSRPAFLGSFTTPPSITVLNEDFETKDWLRLPEKRENLWYRTNERFNPPARENTSKAYRFGRPGKADYNLPGLSPEGHLLSPPLNFKGLGAFELEMDWLMSGDFGADYLMIMIRTELENEILSYTFYTINERAVISWQKLRVEIPSLISSTVRLDIFFTTNGFRFDNVREGAYVDNIVIRASKPVVYFPDPTTDLTP